MVALLLAFCGRAALACTAFSMRLLLYIDMTVAFVPEQVRRLCSIYSMRFFETFFQTRAEDTLKTASVALSIRVFWTATIHQKEEFTAIQRRLFAPFTLERREPGAV